MIHLYCLVRAIWKFYQAPVCLADFHPDKSMWIMVIIFSAIIVLIVTCLLHVNSHR